MATNENTETKEVASEASARGVYMGAPVASTATLATPRKGKTLANDTGVYYCAKERQREALRSTPRQMYNAVERRSPPGSTVPHLASTRPVLPPSIRTHRSTQRHTVHCMHWFPERERRQNGQQDRD